MKNKVYILFCIIALCFASCETQQDVIDTGVANPVFDGTIMDYLRSNEFNWGMTVKMIEKAELTDLFEGKDTEYPEITFLAFTTYSFYNYTFPLYSGEGEPTDEELLELISKEKCKELILKHVFEGRIENKDLPVFDYDYKIFDPNQQGIIEYTSLAGNKLWFTKKEMEIDNIQNSGVYNMAIYSPLKRVYVTLATPGILPENGVVHALDYSYILNNL